MFQWLHFDLCIPVGSSRFGSSVIGSSQRKRFDLRTQLWAFPNLPSNLRTPIGTSRFSQDYYDAQFSLGEAGPPAYVVLSDLDYFKAFNDSNVRQSFDGLSTGLAQLQRYFLTALLQRLGR